MGYHKPEAVCPQCLKTVVNVPRFSFLGSLKFQCPHCHKAFLHPVYRGIYIGILLFIIVVVLIFSLASSTHSPWGDSLLSWVISLTIQVMEMRNLVLIPLFFWAFLRLIGMVYPKLLSFSRKILFGTAILATAGLIIALLGGIAGIMWNGIIVPPLIGTGILSLFLILGFRKKKV